MNGKRFLTTRRSVRKYTNELVDKELVKEIIDLTRFYPSWGNTQPARFHVIQDESMIAEISDSAVKGFVYNQKTLKNTKNLLVLSFVKGKSGVMKGVESSDKDVMKWEQFDAGIAAHQFSLAAHNYGIGSCIFGVIEEDKIAKIIDLPEGETVSAILTFGYTDEEPNTPPRKSVDDILTIKK